MDLQTEVDNFIKQNELECSLSHRLLDLTSELGELSKELLKQTDYGSKNVENEKPGEEWKQEVGDVFFTLIAIANSTNVDLDDCLSTSLHKYKKRLENKDGIGSE